MSAKGNPFKAGGGGPFPPKKGAKKGGGKGGKFPFKKGGRKKPGARDQADALRALEDDY